MIFRRHNIWFPCGILRITHKINPSNSYVGKNAKNRHTTCSQNRKKSKRMYISFIRTRGNMPAFLPSDGKISDRILEGNVSTQNYANCQSILLSRTFFSRVFMNLMVVMATRWVRLEILALANFKWRNPLWFMNRAISIEKDLLRKPKYVTLLFLL